MSEVVSRRQLSPTSHDFSHFLCKSIFLYVRVWLSSHNCDQVTVMSAMISNYILAFCAIILHFPLTSCTIKTIIQPDGEVIVKVQFRNLTIVQTSADEYNLMQVSF